MKTVILTGGMGSGKSAVCRYLKTQGVPVYDSDARTKSLYDRKPALVDRMQAELGVPLRDPQGKFDRKSLASVIFSSPEKKALVESLVYPAVLEDFLCWKRWQRPKGWHYGPVPFVVLESAVILSHQLFDGLGDRIVLVDADESVRVARSVARDGTDSASALRRIRQQTFDRTRVHAVLHNDGSLDALSEETDKVFLNLFLSLQDKNKLY